MGARPPADLGPATALEGGLGLGSLERVELIARLERAARARLPDDTLAGARTLGDLAAAAARALAAGAGAASGAGNGAGSGTGTGDARGAGDGAGFGTGTAAGSGTAARAAPAPPPSSPALAEPARGEADPSAARTVADLLRRRADQDGARAHIHVLDDAGEEERTLSFAEVRAGAAAVATGLRERGVAPGARVAVILPTGADFVFAFYGAILAGATPVPLYPPFRADRIAEYLEREVAILENAGASALVTDARIAPVAALLRDRVRSLAVVETVAALSTRRDEVAVRAAPSDLALIQYSSGSTGEPKGVALSHANLLANVRAVARVHGYGPRSVGVSWLPLYHDMGLIGMVLGALSCGGRLAILSPLAFLARPERWLRAIHRYRATSSAAPNFAYDLCARRVPDDALQGLDLSSWEVAMNAAETVREETIDAFCKRFAPFGFRREALVSCWGLAENSLAATMQPPLSGVRVDRVDRAALERLGRAEPAREGDARAHAFVSCGRPVEGTEVRIAPLAGGEEPLPERAQGRILFRGTSATRGYFGRPDATALVLRPGGWIDSGDLGYVAEGDLFMTGRRKDLIIRAGHNIHPSDVERAAEGVAGVRRGCVAAFGVPDASSGTEVVCVVAESRAREPEARARIAGEVRRAVQEATGAPADRVELVSPGAVPKTSSGKVRRSECRARFLEGTLERRRAPLALQLAGAALGSARARAARALSGLARGALLARSALVMGAVIAAATVPAFALRDPRRVRGAVRLLARALLRLTGLAPCARGLERLPAGAAVYVANHQSFADQFAVLATLPSEVRIAVKHEVTRIPLIGRVATRSEHILVVRDGGERAVDAFARAKELVAAGVPVLIFPEATYRPGVGLWPFKLGAFRIALETGAPVVPVAIRGTRAALPPGKALLRPSRIEVEVGAPIEAEGPADFAGYVRLRDAAAEAIAAMTGEPRLG
jgi:1-acyl-sn-glycerol-3-phosphate acyltransferase